jgi:pimeloyl-ACP methyl ester carboxylesterase
MFADMAVPTVPLTEKELKLHFQATFSNDVTPFTAAVDEQFLAATKQKVSLTRFVDDMEQPEFTDGPPRREAEKVARYWLDQYDWRVVEATINKQYKQFTTIVETPETSFTAPTPLHFVHHISPRANAIPLLFIHGWPGSFLEVEDLLEPLVNPSTPADPEFHVVAPSIPGYDFSPSPRRPGFGYRQAAATFHALMQKLGYHKFVFQGGDAGDFIGRYLAVDFPDALVAGHSNFWIVPPTAEDLARIGSGEASDDEKYVVEKLGGFVNDHWSYGQIHQTRPLKLAVGLTDSPVGLAMWIYDICVTVVEDPEVFGPERLITWTMMHWIPGPYGALGLYKQGRAVSQTFYCSIQLIVFLTTCHRTVPYLCRA